MESLSPELNVPVERSPLFPNPVSCIADMAWTAAGELRNRSPWGVWGQWARETWGSMEAAVRFDPGMILWAALICVVLTAVRGVLNRHLFTPIARSYKLSPESIEKFPESIWKFSVYTITWTWSAYITHDMDLMFDILSHWTTWYPARPVETSVYWLFTFEVGFYLHYSYGMLFLEARRKDFAVLMAHHILTVALIVGCYTVRFHIVGVLLIFIHDIGDVFLEGSKSILYFKEQDGRLVKWVETCANIGFLMFATEYFLFRIYWFVTKALYSTLYVSIVVFPTGPFYLPFNFMLLSLLAMQIFWFTMIVKLLVKVLILREELSDVRDIKKEDGEIEGETKEVHKNGGESRINGHLASHEDKKRQ
jgi:ceramide synthetase